jgi:hypothetical protein
MDTASTVPVSPIPIRWTNEPVLERHAGQPDHVTGRSAQRQRNSRHNQRHPARLARAGGTNTLSRYAGRRVG